VHVSRAPRGVSNAGTFDHVNVNPATNHRREAFKTFTVGAEYVSGHLAAREGEPMVQVLEDVLMMMPVAGGGRADLVVLVDGSGVHHPKRFGLACHVGTSLRLPTIGVAKTLLFVDGIGNEQVQHMEGHGCAALTSNKDGKVLGNALVAGKNTTSPVFVSVGHQIDLSTATDIVSKCCVHRIPEPIRQADIRGRQHLRDLAATTTKS
jgi:deoxyinosine 3'endonuclease (endonuclease V)